MIQGGDPTGTGKGGQSIWGEPFADEFHAELKVRPEPDAQAPCGPCPRRLPQGRLPHAARLCARAFGAMQHDKRGVVSMVGKKPDTNRSQFFITFDAHSHLDNVYTVFGQCVPRWGIRALARLPGTIRPLTAPTE